MPDIGVLGTSQNEQQDALSVGTVGGGDDPVGVDQYRVAKPESRDRGRDLADLFGQVHARVAGERQDAGQHVQENRRVIRDCQPCRPNFSRPEISGLVSPRSVYLAGKDHSTGLPIE
jgi:hypothetical protein